MAIIGVASVVCCTACTAGDVCNDLKTGAIVGATPHRQQWMQVLGVCVAAFVMAPVLTVLHEGTEGGIGGPELSAPQAQLFRSLASGFFGETELPLDRIGIGVAVGVALLLADSLLESRRSSFRLHVMPVAVGMYLPLRLAVPILIGGIVAHLWTRGVAEPEERERRLHRGVLFSSGVIAGEALMGGGARHPGLLRREEARSAGWDGLRPDRDRRGRGPGGVRPRDEAGRVRAPLIGPGGPGVSSAAW